MALSSLLKTILLSGALGLGCLASSSFARAQERLGRLELEDLLLEPRFTLMESRRGDFALQNSYVSARWILDESFSAVLKIGTQDLLGSPTRYGRVDSNEIAVAEGYLQADIGYLGRIRFGIVPIAFGLEGGAVEPHLMLPRSLIFQRRWLGLRDFGLSYHVSNDGFFSDWTIHNGESGPDLDDEAWFTARWGYDRGRNLRVGVSGVTGRTSPLSTDPNGNGDSVSAGLDVTRPSRTRAGNVFAFVKADPFEMIMEATAGETRQEDDVSKFRALHFDIGYTISEWFSVLARYDTFDPRTDSSGDRVQDIVMGLALNTRYRTSRFYILGAKSIQENVSPDSHRVQVVWRMTPTATEGRSPL